jgi:multiple sugar transport system permease protein
MTSPLAAASAPYRALWDRLSYPWQRRLTRTAFALSLLVTLLIILFPLYWMASSAVRPLTEIYTRPVSYLPVQLTTIHYEKVLFDTNLPRYYLNSIVVAAGVVVLTTTAATLGGYGLTRLDIPFKKTFARSVLFGYMFPPILLAIPMFIFWKELGIIDSYLGLMLAETAIALPFSLWLMWKFFQSVPESLEESAQMAGASRFRAFYEIALPQAKPGAIAVAVYAYSASWNAYTFPKIIMISEGKWPLTVGVHTFVQQFQVNWGMIMAAGFLMIIPSFIFIYSLQKYLLRGFRI